ncbi:hypothetical protein VMCG_04575 [Cytospora schulzeri]|uniref:Uncharacterized protein n=1 Tax=Cytospora schulzeri TaxID=448051 RepID=A0A423WRV2_9PEZI|nr:hypothetical protein VMCG_04575 [Valsa malicola]
MAPNLSVSVAVTGPFSASPASRPVLLSLTGFLLFTLLHSIAAAPKIVKHVMTNPTWNTLRSALLYTTNTTDLSGSGSAVMVVAPESSMADESKPGIPARFSSSSLSRTFCPMEMKMAPLSSWEKSMREVPMGTPKTAPNKPWNNGRL